MALIEPGGPTQDFGNVAPGNTSSIRYILTNISEQYTLQIVRMHITTDTGVFTWAAGDPPVNPPNFPSCPTGDPNDACGIFLQPGESTAFKIVFTPPTANVFTGTLEITAEEEGYPLPPETYNLTGNGITGPGIAIDPPNWDFGHELIGDTTDERLFSI